MPIRSTRCWIDVASYPLDQKARMARSRTTSCWNSLGRAIPDRVSVSERSVKKMCYGPMVDLTRGGLDDASGKTRHYAGGVQDADPSRSPGGHAAQHRRPPGLRDHD